MTINRESGSEKGFPPSPDHIAVIGGGRWARVLTEVLCGLVSPSVGISAHSFHHAGSMSAWVTERGFEERVHVSSDWPQLSSVKSSAVIVANAAQDHEKAVEWALSAGVPVLVEKPVAVSATSVRRLMNLAHDRDVYLAAAHIFLFARYIENFSKLVSEAEGIRFLRVCWMDPQFESRYGEQKKYDPGLPIFADWLPHVLSIVGFLMPGLPQRCEKLDFSRGGAHLELDLMLGDTPCRVQLVRNGDRRQRIIEVSTAGKMLRMDFSTEPGMISFCSETFCGDPDWEVRRRPAARMLAAFLQGAVGGGFDGRLNIEIALRASQVIDQTWSLYRSALMPWLMDRLVTSSEKIDDDLRYALTEIIHSKGSLRAITIEEEIERVRRQFFGMADPHRLKGMAEPQDPSIILNPLPCES